MKVQCLSLILCFFAFDFVTSDDRFKFKDCSKGRGIVTVNQFSLSPDPISLSKNVSATVNLTLHEDIPPNTYVKRNIYKVTSFFGVPLDIPVPCISDIGSCSTNGCKYLNSLKTQVCPFVPSHLECECPLKAGNYAGKDIILPMPEMGTMVKLLASGKFRVEWKLVQKEDWAEKDIVCFVFTGKANP